MLTLSAVPTKCVYVAQASPDSNFYEHGSLFAGRFSGAGDIYRLFMEFDLANKGNKFKQNVQSAFLCLELSRNEVPQVPGTINLYIHRLIESFDEKKINWNTQPMTFDEVDGIIAIQAMHIGKLKIDITRLVNGWLDNGIKNFGLSLRGEESINSLVGFTSANLVINYDIDKEAKSFNKFYSMKSEHFDVIINSEMLNNSKELAKIIKNRKYKGIVVYPSAIKWEPIQRPQHILRELSRMGYLCFFCNAPSNEFCVEEVENNFFVINSEDYLLQVISNKFIIVLCTWLVQMAWADYVPNKIVWYDVLDKLELFSMYDSDMLTKHLEVIKTADILTYSAKLLCGAVMQRDDAIYLPNAVNPQDFTEDIQTSISDKMQKIVDMGEPIIGYFGAIEDWFDDDIVNKIASKKPNWQFVIIGEASNEKKVSLTKPNLHLLGRINHCQLPNYANYFKVCIIPFRINSITNCVSPIKLFEYASLGKPIVSTSFEEIKQYECDWICLADNANAFESGVQHCLSSDIQNNAYNRGKEFANSNLWLARIQKFEKRLKSSLRGMFAFSNIDNTGTIAAITSTFLDFDGDNFFSGGAERYLCDLFDVFKSVGLRMLVYQYGNSSWVRRYNNIDVISLSDGTVNAENLIAETTDKFNNLSYSLTHATTILNIYSAFFESYPKAKDFSIGISHGVAWDCPNCIFNDGEHFWERNKRVIEAARLCDTIISVDSNTANWYQTIDFNLAIKTNVIPNYVDIEKFTHRIDFDKQREKIIIIYPRRFYAPRGFYLILEIMDEVLQKYHNVEFHFVGRGLEEDTMKIIEKQKQWEDRVKWYSLSLSDMPNAYRTADIALIPTLHSEGTSLSCLEAMASGNAIIATRVGGLTDLIINGYNGLLTSPIAEDIKTAIEDLLDNSLKLVKLKQNAVDVSKAFCKSNWENQWLKVIKSTINLDEVNENSQSWKLALICLWNNKYLENNSVKALITELLCRDCLVYVKLKDTHKPLPNSFGRLQFLAWEEEIFANVDVVIADEKSAKRLNITPNILLTKELLSKFNSDPINYWNEKLKNESIV